MMRKQFISQLHTLNDTLTEMGGLIEYAIQTAVCALVNQDVTLAKEAIAYDEKIDAKEKEIEHLCFDILLLQHPVASDLWVVSSALKMITDMERIGDQSADISELTLIMAGSPYIKKLEHIPLMAEATIKMVNDAIDAFVKKDTELAVSVIEYDDVVDNYFVTVRDDLIELIQSNPDNAAQAFDLMMVAKYFERIGDHAVNIAEWVLFSLTGTKEYINE
jgi:phosphate transport system protein